MVELDCLPYGVGHGEEGVCLLVRMGPYRVLLDFGLTDLSALSADFAVQGAPDLVLCSHAHGDHAQGLLEFHQRFPQVHIYASEVTTQLLPLNWPTEEVPGFCQALPWRSPLEFRDGLTAELWPAGHLPGAAAFLLTYTPPASRSNPHPRPYTVFYTGDFFLSSSRLVEGLPLDALRGLRPDVLIVEGSYGTARHPRRRQQENQLADRIGRAIAEQQSVLLPVPTLGLGQEVLMLLRSHHQFTGRNVDIWVDGTVATGCDAYLELLPHLPASVQNFAQHQPLFWDERVKPRVRRLQTPEQRQSLGDPPCIVLTDISADWQQYCPHHPEAWLVLQPQQDRKFEPLPATEFYLLSEHCDGAGTTQLIHNLRPQHVVLVHGSPTYLADLTSLDELNHRYHLHTPGVGTLVELPIGETFLQPAAPESRYEGELTEQGTSIVVSLPNHLTADPRWQKFADTGLVEARWQGEELVLRGVPQWELLSQGRDRLTDSLDLSLFWRDCCGTCQHYRGQRCWNANSPLAGFKVTPDGYCPVYERLQGEP